MVKTRPRGTARFHHLRVTPRARPRPGHSPGLLSVGGDRRSRIWASFSPSTHWTSKVRSNGQLELQRAETAIHEQPDSTKSRSPGGTEKGMAGQVTHPSPHSSHVGCPVPCSPGNRLMSQLSCFLEILVQLRSRETGCRRMMPLSIRGVMDLQWFRSMRVHNRLSQHLRAEPSGGGTVRAASSRRGPLPGCGNSPTTQLRERLLTPPSRTFSVWLPAAHSRASHPVTGEGEYRGQRARKRQSWGLWQ